MVLLVIDDGWTIEATAERFQVDAKTVIKWRDRYRNEGEEGLFDRSPDRKRRRMQHRQSAAVESSSCANSADRAQVISVTRSAAPAQPFNPF